jgi:hypothetical protein
MHSVTGNVVVEDLEKLGRNKISVEVMSRRASPAECGRRGERCDGKKNVLNGIWPKLQELSQGKDDSSS